MQVIAKTRATMSYLLLWDSYLILLYSNNLLSPMWLPKLVAIVIMDYYISPTNTTHIATH